MYLLCKLTEIEGEFKSSCFIGNTPCVVVYIRFYPCPGSPTKYYVTNFQQIRSFFPTTRNENYPRWEYVT